MVVLQEALLLLQPGDGILINDGGTMRMTNVDTVSTYFSGHNVGGGNIVTTGALDSGSITSGFGAIDNGTSNIRSATITAETAFVPDAANGATLGTASLEFADMYLHDGGIVYFGADQDVELAHVADVGLTLKTATTSDDTKATLTLQTGDTDIAANDVLGQLHFQAPDEGAGTDAILVAAGIAAISEGDFSASNNATKLSFQTGASEAASEKMSLSSAGLLTIADDLIIGDGKTIGSASDPDSMTIASGGAVTFSQVPVFPNNTVESADIQADAITGAKIADDAINSEHYTDGSIDTAHIADVNVTQGKIADQAINEAKMQISNAPQNGYMLTAQSGNTGGMTWAEAGGGSWNLLQTLTASTSSTLSFTSGIDGTYQNYAVVFSGVKPSNDNSTLYMRWSVDGGSNYLSSAYLYATFNANTGNGSSSTGSASASQIVVHFPAVGSDSNGENCMGTIKIAQPSDTSQKTLSSTLSSGFDNAGRNITCMGAGSNTTKSAINALQFFFSAGTISVGKFKLYGIT